MMVIFDDDEDDDGDEDDNVADDDAEDDDVEDDEVQEEDVEDDDVEDDDVAGDEDEDDNAEDELDDDKVGDDDVEKEEDDDVEEDNVEKHDEQEDNECWCCGRWGGAWWCRGSWGQRGRWWCWGPRQDPHFARACAVDMHINISQEPFYTEIYRKNAAAQLEHPDQAPAFTLTVRTPQCGHTVWGKTRKTPKMCFPCLLKIKEICTAPPPSKSVLQVWSDAPNAHWEWHCHAQSTW